MAKRGTDMIDGSKVKMQCEKCKIIMEWYPSFWHEVMDYKTPSGKYLCPDCAIEIKYDAIEKWFKQREGLK